MSKIFVGLDVSQKFTHICAVDAEGNRGWQGKCATTPEAIAETIASKIPGATCIGMESGPLAAWLWHALRQNGLPVVCVHARHVAGYLNLRLNKTDKNDARGIAEYLQKGNCSIVNVKTMNSYRVRTLMGERAQLVSIRTDLKNQIRGVLKLYGLILSEKDGNSFDGKIRASTNHCPEARAMIEPLQAVLKTVQEQVAVLDKLVEGYAGDDRMCSHLMTIPGVGAVTALAFTAAIDNPARFRKSRTVGAYFGLTNRRYQSGEVDRGGRISKQGDRLMRTYLFEAAGVLLTRVRKWSALKSWGMRIAKRSGMWKARVAVARKLAVIMHQMLTTGEEFRWSNAQAAEA